MPEIGFQILGPLTVTVDGVDQPVGGAKQRAVLAALMLASGRAVPIDRLIDLVWDEPPRSAVANLRTYAAGLRKLVGHRLVAMSAGYRLDVEPDESDVLRFHDAVRTARDRLAAGDAVAARAGFASGLALWTGRPGADLPPDAPVRRLVEGLAESRVLALEEYVAVRLDLGEDEALVPILRTETAEHPTRERLWGQLVTALYRSGDVGGALAAYQQAATVLRRELGMDPGPDLRTLHRAVLDRAPAVSRRRRPTFTPVPQQLPIDARVLVGRDRELKMIIDAVEHHEGARPAIVAIDGPGGIGKSALAVHAAHVLAARHQDGQLYIDLQGARAGLAPVGPGAALAALLRALGPDVPASGAVEADAARLRTLAAGRRLLVVLDNAIDAEQVMPLLPGGAGSTILITARRRLSTIDAGLHLTLDVLSDGDSVELLRRVGQLVGEPEAVADIARMCGGLPLAVRIAAARLTKRSDWTAADLACRLADDRKRLDELGVDDLDVRASFTVSYDGLSRSPAPIDQHAAAVYRRLGVLPLPHFDCELVAAAADLDVDTADAALERLLDLRLITAGRDCYRLHDLLRLFAAERADRELSAAEQTAAQARAAWYLADTSRRAGHQLRPTPWQVDIGPDPRRHPHPTECADAAAARSWFDKQRPVLIAAVRRLGAAHPITMTALADAMTADLERDARWPELADLNERIAALAAARGDRLTQARALRVVATVHQRCDRPDEALRLIETSLAAAREVDDSSTLIGTLNAYGIFLTEGGRHDEASAALHEALAAAESDGQTLWTGVVLNALGMHYRERGRFTDAADYLARALAVRCARGDKMGEMYTRMQQARLYASLGESDSALVELDVVLGLAIDLGTDDFELQARRCRFAVLRLAGRQAESEAELSRAATVCRRVPDAQARDKLQALARFVERSDPERERAAVFSSRAPVGV